MTCEKRRPVSVHCKTRKLSRKTSAFFFFPEPAPVPSAALHLVARGHPGRALRGHPAARDRRGAEAGRRPHLRGGRQRPRDRAGRDPGQGVEGHPRQAGRGPHAGNTRWTWQPYCRLKIAEGMIQLLQIFRLFAPCGCSDKQHFIYDSGRNRRFKASIISVKLRQARYNNPSGMQA